MRRWQGLGVCDVEVRAGEVTGVQGFEQGVLVRRLTSIGTAMRLLSSGEVGTAVPSASDRDEIGEMARSLEVFRASEIERAESGIDRHRRQAIAHKFWKKHRVLAKVIRVGLVIGSHRERDFN